jgi:hypothetical protein
MAKSKVVKFETLGRPIGSEAKRFEFINYANEHKSAVASLFGRSCGRVDFIFPVLVGRMTADDAERLAEMLLLSAKEAREGKLAKDDAATAPYVGA